MCLASHTLLNLIYSNKWIKALYRIQDTGYSTQSKFSSTFCSIFINSKIEQFFIGVSENDISNKMFHQRFLSCFQASCFIESVLNQPYIWVTDASGTLVSPQNGRMLWRQMPSVYFKVLILRI